MIYETEGIVLHKTVFADNKAIFHLYTSGEGLRSYIVYTSFKKEKKSRWIALQPLAVVHLKAERRRSGTLDYLKSAELAHVPCATAAFDCLKASVRMFLNEILYKTLQAAPPDEALFSFVEESLQAFDTHRFTPDFHLRFLWRLTRFFGCVPLDNRSGERPYFNVETAQCATVKTDADATVSAWIFRMMEEPLFPETPEDTLPSANRSAMLDCLLAYYARHVDASVANVRSHLVLKEVLR